MIELYLNNELVDLTGNEDIAIDYALFNLSDLSTRIGSRSVEFALPKTSRNRRIFENADDLNSLSTMPYRRFSCRLLANGVDQKIVFATLNSVTATYNIRVYDSQTDFYSIIKGRKLQDLPVDQFNHYHCFNNVVNGRFGIDAYCYPIIDNFAITPNATIDNTTRAIAPAYLYPAAKVEYMLNKIVEEAGYTFVNEIADVVNYPADGMIMPTHKVLKRDLDMGRYEGSLSTSTPQASPPGGISLGYTLIAYDTVDAGYTYGYWDSAAASMNAATQHFVDEVDADITIDFEVTNTTGADLTFFFRLDVSGTTVYTEVQNIPASSTVPVSIVRTGVEIRHNSPNFGSVEVYFSTNAPAGSLELTSTITYSNVVLYKQTHPEVIYNNTKALQAYCTISTSMPDWEQSKLVKEYCKATCAILVVSDFFKTVTLIPFKKLIDNINSFEDWSNKVDLTNEPEVIFSLDKYGQKNNFKYAEDETVIKPSGTDYVLEIDNENLDGQKDVIDMEFAGTESVERLNGITIPNIKLFDDNLVVNNVEPRLLILRYFDSGDFTPTGGIVYDDSTSSTTVTTDLPIPYFIDEAEPFNLGFGVNLFEMFYPAFEGILTNLRVVNANLRVNAADINQLNFLKPVYIKYFNAYFYINSINGYTPDSAESTEVELVKLF